MPCRQHPNTICPASAAHLRTQTRPTTQPLPPHAPHTHTHTHPPHLWRQRELHLLLEAAQHEGAQQVVRSLKLGVVNLRLVIDGQRPAASGSGGAVVVVRWQHMATRSCAGVCGTVGV